MNLEHNNIITIILKKKKIIEYQQNACTYTYRTEQNKIEQKRKEKHIKGFCDENEEQDHYYFHIRVIYFISTTINKIR
jgi:hypothetical protein